MGKGGGDRLGWTPYGDEQSRSAAGRCKRPKPLVVGFADATLRPCAGAGRRAAPAPPAVKSGTADRKPPAAALEIRRSGTPTAEAATGKLLTFPLAGLAARTEEAEGICLSQASGDTTSEPSPSETP